MRPLQDLLYQVPLAEVRGELVREVREVQYDSRAVQPQDVFVAVRGTQTDGHAYIPQALAQGATVIVCEAIPETLIPDVTYIGVRNAAEALAWLCANYCDNPTRQLKVIGVTGTNGKTTTATLLHQLFTALGYTCGLVSTVVNKIGEEALPARLTTPDPKALQVLFRQMVDAGCTYAFMECSSIALHQHRCTGIQFAGGIFTNITHDHLDYHGTFANYIAAKQLFFNMLPASAFALTNVDDRNGRILVQNTRARVLTYALQTVAGYHARVLDNTLEGLQLDVEGRQVWCRMVGAFNAYNLLAVISAARELGHPLDEVLLKASVLTGAPGRFEVLHLPQAVVGIVDYAHTPDALENVLKTLREMQTSGRIVTVVGCGGDRDRTKRPAMARIAAELSDAVVLTSDNPRTEDPATILNEMEAGIPAGARRRVLRITDRREAIQTAARTAQPHDVILLAGKGHETYQEIMGVKYPFDDSAELALAFKAH